MASRAPAAASHLRIPATVAGALVVVGAALVGSFVDRSSATSGDGDRAKPSPSVATQATTTPPSMAQGAPGPSDRATRDLQSALSAADGVVPDGVTVFDEHPAVDKLDPGLRAALRRAATAAADDGIALYIVSGWRSTKYQEQLLRAAISTYGSEEEAARWVAAPDRSAHVSGDAVDIGPSRASRWLSEHGSTYGLCPVYRNEPWHFELLPTVAKQDCPRLYPDPTHDPRMKR